jgi:hypothetical protein
MSSALEMQSLAGGPNKYMTLFLLCREAGPKEMRVELARLESEYFARHRDIDGSPPGHRVPRTSTRFMRRTSGTSPT